MPPFNFALHWNKSEGDDALTDGNYSFAIYNNFMLLLPFSGDN